MSANQSTAGGRKTQMATFNDQCILFFHHSTKINENKQKPTEKKGSITVTAFLSFSKRTFLSTSMDTPPSLPPTEGN